MLYLTHVKFIGDFKYKAYFIIIFEKADVDKSLGVFWNIIICPLNIVYDRGKFKDEQNNFKPFYGSSKAKGLVILMKKTELPQVAYFSMEYAIDESLRTYAGGLGILAGDYLKGANDYNFPITAIGIKWKQGYTDQYIDKGNDVPYDSYRNNVYDCLEDTGIMVDVQIRHRTVYCKVFCCNAFGIKNLYLLDTDIPENDGDARWITGQLYGWFGEERIAQEIVLGIGGVKALRKLGIKVDKYHFNEGHALFAGFELLKEEMDDGLSFEAAVDDCKKSIVFTTHTPIVEGNESHPIDSLIYMGANNGLNKKQLVSLGGNPFNMTAAALRLSAKSNAVSQLHAETSNKMWKDLAGRSKIIGITNAIHIPTWVDTQMIDCAEKCDRSDHSKAELWNRHMDNKRKMIAFVNSRNSVKLKEDILTIGFSRRAAPYKRSDFIFSDTAFIEPLLKNNKLQIIFSGKAHPLDDVGKEIVKKIVDFAQLYSKNVVFLENYDMEIGQMLTKGCDVWLNNPRRPKEASGTSGMKAAMNGVLNCSILDGWWPEMCKDGINGWQIGDGFESKNVKKQDKNDLRSLQQKLLTEIIPTYYENREKWTDMMLESIKGAKDQFNVKRMLEEYFTNMYEC